MKKAMDLVRILVKVTFLGYNEKEDLRKNFMTNPKKPIDLGGRHCKISM